MEEVEKFRMRAYARCFGCRFPSLYEGLLARQTGY